MSGASREEILGKSRTLLDRAPFNMASGLCTIRNGAAWFVGLAISVQIGTQRVHAAKTSRAAGTGCCLFHTLCASRRGARGGLGGGLEEWAWLSCL